MDLRTVAEDDTTTATSSVTTTAAGMSVFAESSTNRAFKVPAPRASTRQQAKGPSRTHQRRFNKVRPVEYAQCYLKLRCFLERRIAQHMAACATEPSAGGSPPNLPDFRPTEDDIREMFGKDRIKSNHGPAAINPLDALDPAMVESRHYAPSGGPGLGAGCNVGEPRYTLNRQDPIATALRLWPEQVLSPLIVEMERYLEAWGDLWATEPPRDPLEEHRKPVGASQIRYGPARLLY